MIKQENNLSMCLWRQMLAHTPQERWRRLTGCDRGWRSWSRRCLLAAPNLALQLSVLLLLLPLLLLIRCGKHANIPCNPPSGGRSGYTTTVQQFPDTLPDTAGLSSAPLRTSLDVNPADAHQCQTSSSSLRCLLRHPRSIKVMLAHWHSHQPRWRSCLTTPWRARLPLSVRYRPPLPKTRLDRTLHWLHRKRHRAAISRRQLS